MTDKPRSNVVYLNRARMNRAGRLKSHEILKDTHPVVASSFLSSAERKFEPPLLDEKVRKDDLEKEQKRLAQQAYDRASSLACVLFVVSALCDVGAILDKDRATRVGYVLGTSALSLAAGAVFVNGYRKYYDAPHYKP